MSAPETSSKRQFMTSDDGRFRERTSGMARFFRGEWAPACGAVLGFLPLLLLIGNHLFVSFFPSLQVALVYCTLPSYQHVAQTSFLDAGAPIFYGVEALLGIPLVLLMGKVFHWNPDVARRWTFGFVPAILLDFMIYVFVIFPINFHQCFHLVW